MVRAWFIIPLAVLATGGCDQQPKDGPSDAKESFAARNPVGRFRMVPRTLGDGTATGVFILDTRDGSVQYCQPNAGAPTVVAMDCSATTPAAGLEY